MSSWLTRIARIAAAAEVPEGVCVYLFGSALRRTDPADLDLLVVYRDGRVAEARALIGRLRANADELEYPPTDFVVLSESEDAVVAFAASEGCVLVSPSVGWGEADLRDLIFLDDRPVP